MGRKKNSTSAQQSNKGPTAIPSSVPITTDQNSEFTNSLDFIWQGNFMGGSVGDINDGDHYNCDSMSGIFTLSPLGSFRSVYMEDAASRLNATTIAHLAPVSPLDNASVISYMQDLDQEVSISSSLSVSIDPPVVPPMQSSSFRREKLTIGQVCISNLLNTTVNFDPLSVASAIAPSSFGVAAVLCNHYRLNPDMPADEGTGPQAIGLAVVQIDQAASCFMTSIIQLLTLVRNLQDPSLYGSPNVSDFKLRFEKLIGSEDKFSLQGHWDVLRPHFRGLLANPETAQFFATLVPRFSTWRSFIARHGRLHVPFYFYLGFLLQIFKYVEIHDQILQHLERLMDVDTAALTTTPSIYADFMLHMSSLSEMATFFDLEIKDFFYPVTWTLQPTAAPSLDVKAFLALLHLHIHERPELPPVATIMGLCNLLTPDIKEYLCRFVQARNLDDIATSLRVATDLLPNIMGCFTESPELQRRYILLILAAYFAFGKEMLRHFVDSDTPGHIHAGTFPPQDYDSMLSIRRHLENVHQRGDFPRSIVQQLIVTVVHLSNQYQSEVMRERFRLAAKLLAYDPEVLQSILSSWLQRIKQHPSPFYALFAFKGIYTCDHPLFVVTLFGFLRATASVFRKDDLYALQMSTDPMLDYKLDIFSEIHVPLFLLKAFMPLMELRSDFTPPTLAAYYDNLRSAPSGQITYGPIRFLSFPELGQTQPYSHRHLQALHVHMKLWGSESLIFNLQTQLRTSLAQHNQLSSKLQGATTAEAKSDSALDTDIQPAVRVVSAQSTVSEDQEKRNVAGGNEAVLKKSKKKLTGSQRRSKLLQETATFKLGEEESSDSDNSDVPAPLVSGRNPRAPEEDGPEATLADISDDSSSGEEGSKHTNKRYENPITVAERLGEDEDTSQQSANFVPLPLTESVKGDEASVTEFLHAMLEEGNKRKREDTDENDNGRNKEDNDEYNNETNEDDKDVDNSEYNYEIQGHIVQPRADGGQSTGQVTSRQEEQSHFKMYAFRNVLLNGTETFVAVGREDDAGDIIFREVSTGYAGDSEATQSLQTPTAGGGTTTVPRQIVNVRSSQLHQRRSEPTAHDTAAGSSKRESTKIYTADYMRDHDIYVHTVVLATTSSNRRTTYRISSGDAYDLVRNGKEAIAGYVRIDSRLVSGEVTFQPRVMEWLTHEGRLQSTTIHDVGSEVHPDFIGFHQRLNEAEIATGYLAYKQIYLHVLREGEKIRRGLAIELHPDVTCAKVISMRPLITATVMDIMEMSKVKTDGLQSTTRLLRYDGLRVGDDPRVHEEERVYRHEDDFMGISHRESHFYRPLETYSNRATYWRYIVPAGIDLVPMLVHIIGPGIDDIVLFFGNKYTESNVYQPMDVNTIFTLSSGHATVVYDKNNFKILVSTDELNIITAGKVLMQDGKRLPFPVYLKVFEADQHTPGVRLSGIVQNYKTMVVDPILGSNFYGNISNEVRRSIAPYHLRLESLVIAFRNWLVFQRKSVRRDLRVKGYDLLFVRMGSSNPWIKHETMGDIMPRAILSERWQANRYFVSTIFRFHASRVLPFNEDEEDSSFTRSNDSVVTLDNSNIRISNSIMIDSGSSDA